MNGFNRRLKFLYILTSLVFPTYIIAKDVLNVKKFQSIRICKIISPLIFCATLSIFGLVFALTNSRHSNGSCGIPDVYAENCSLACRYNQTGGIEMERTLFYPPGYEINANPTSN